MECYLHNIEDNSKRIVTPNTYVRLISLLNSLNSITKINISKLNSRSSDTRIVFHPVFGQIKLA